VEVTGCGNFLGIGSHPAFVRVVTTTNGMSRRDQIVVENLSLVRAIAARLRASLPVHVELDDLMHAGVLGLIDAATRYDEGKDVSFQTYAKHRIKGAMLDSLRQMDWASRDMRKRHKQVESATRELAAELDREPEEAEVAEKMGVAINRWRRMAMELKTVGLLSASTRPAESENTTTPEFPARDSSRPDQVCERSQLSEKLTFAIGTLPERYREVVFMYYSQDLTMKEIGSRMSINESRVSQIHKTALEKLAVVLQTNGIESSAALV
jgi:RNA polymerase sigma factor for flagellar operon FliA